MEHLDTNKNKRLDKSELPLFIAEKISAAHETDTSCRDFMVFAFASPQKQMAATTGDLTPEVLKRAEKAAALAIRNNLIGNLKSPAAKAAFPRGVEAMPTTQDVAPITAIAIAQIKACAAVPLHQR